VEGLDKVLAQGGWVAALPAVSVDVPVTAAAYNIAAVLPTAAAVIDLKSQRRNCLPWLTISVVVVHVHVGPSFVNKSDRC